MSTNNFSFENILVVIPDFKFDNRCLDEECPHFEEEGIHCEHVSDYYDYDTEGFKMYIKEVQDQLVKIGFDSCDRYDNDRNYGGNIIAELCLRNNSETSTRTIEVVIRSGYYDGANIDYKIIEDDDYLYEDNTKGRAREMKALQNKVDKIIPKIKKILRKNGTELLKVGQFSNGEAVYELKNKKAKK